MKAVEDVGGLCVFAGTRLRVTKGGTHNRKNNAFSLYNLNSLQNSFPHVLSLGPAAVW